MSKNQVVVAYDFSDTADVALERALDLVIGAPDHVLHFITVLDSSQPYRTADEIQHQLLERLRWLFEARAPSADVEFFVHARIGQPVEEILGLAEEVGADLILMGSHGRTGVRRVLLGSVSEAVLRGARCPVLVARKKGYEHVALEKVVETPHPVHHARGHRYSYSSATIHSSPTGWSIG